MRVRHITVDDIDALAAMLTEFVKERHTAGEHTQPTERTHRALMTALVAVGLTRTAPGAVLVAEEGETPIGLAAFAVQTPAVDTDLGGLVARSLLTYVRPEHRGQGVARELVSRRDAIAATLGCAAIQSATRLDNAGMRGVLAAAGYVPEEVTFTRRLGGG